MELSKKDRVQLCYLLNAHKPLWGGHLHRGEPLSDPDMQRWLDAGLIEIVGEGAGYWGYATTDKAKQLLKD